MNTPTLTSTLHFLLFQKLFFCPTSYIIFLPKFFYSHFIPLICGSMQTFTFNLFISFVFFQKFWNKISRWWSLGVFHWKVMNLLVGFPLLLCPFLCQFDFLYNCLVFLYISSLPCLDLHVLNTGYYSSIFLMSRRPYWFNTSGSNCSNLGLSFRPMGCIMA